jgi:hypothetical protein
MEKIRSNPSIARQFLFGGAADVIIQVLVGRIFGYSAREVVLLGAPVLSIFVIIGYAFILFSFYLYISGQKNIDV